MRGEADPCVLEAALVERVRAAADSFRAFLVDEVNPAARACEAQRTPLPAVLFRRAAEVGLLGHALPPVLGGGGGGVAEWGLLLEQVGLLCDDGCFPQSLGITAAIAEIVLASDDEALIERYARPIARGELFGALAYTDGADPFAFRSSARRDGEGWVLNGAKPIVTGALFERVVFATWVRDERTDDLLVFLVEPSDAGVAIEPLRTLGLHSAGLGRLVLADVHVPDERLVVAADGLATAQVWLNRGRLPRAAAMLGRMQAVYERSLAALSAKVRGGRRLADLPTVQAALGRALVGIEASRALVHRALAAAARRRGDVFWDPLANAAKYFVTEQAVSLGMTLLRLHGSEGFIADGPWERFLRDATSLLAGSGAQDILELDLGAWAVAQADLSTRSQMRRHA